MRRTRYKTTVFLLILFLSLSLAIPGADTLQGMSFNIDFGPAGEEGALGPLQLLAFLSLITLAPSILIMMTSFTRILIVFSFLRNALGAQAPPNQVIVGVALFLSFFIMWPVGTEINDTAVQPYLAGEIDQAECLDNMSQPIKVFMLKQTKAPELNLFLSMANEMSLSEGVTIEGLTDLGMHIVIPSFILSELKRAFIIGFMLFIPFLVIDVIVASTLMSMGMVMLPPSMISLPFKLMMFVVVDGWSLIMETLVRSFSW
ncbi:MAG: flagellar type III secretion system pore protein FliP [Clostridiales bacterium]|nr:flagellar type III secretion system pore protein FliP [Clostridiales bacterium]